MNLLNFANETFVRFDQTIWDELAQIEQQIRQQMETPGHHYLVKDLMTHASKQFFDRWEPERFPRYQVEGSEKLPDYQGIYAFARDMDNRLRFEYVGISRTIAKRFRSHTTGKSSLQANWAWLMVEKKEKDEINRLKKSDPAKYKSKVAEKIQLEQTNFISKCKFTFVTIKSATMMHMAEVYCANHLQAHWNSFRTH